MEIRPVIGEDIPDLATMFMRVYETFDVGKRWNCDAAALLFAHYLNRHPDLAFVAHEGNALLGAVFMDMKPWWDGNRLTEGELFVDPTMQCQGVGSALLKTVFTHAARRHGAITWEGITFAHREFPMSWYKKLGFKQTTEWALISCDIATALQRL